MVESMTPSNPVYTSLVTLPKSGEWKTKACSFPYFFVLLWNYSTLSRLFYYPRKMKFILHVDLPLFGWWLICQCYYFLIVFSTENIKKDTNFFFCRQLFVFWKNKKSIHATLYLWYLLQLLRWCFIHLTMPQFTGCYFHKSKQIKIICITHAVLQ